ncbi:uncharacterized protein LACBIDRAFT_315080 [Laccaria bicolor S238N-H82]|uniref:Predicted protein n=1 Tax=Laccaria bicolor (strain S238N-H82 / ATCC MYA-4686) TaxID=486041 RepID=B0DZS1_LACBS|nr:uncharacterized protein LACBIDRAFT_315080 [Laccaria bicolor S238N-H82]EDQ99924.1 predicted protein [Laccaria bicolor S238N-H82]|eukprot:XP_001889467.1 predicted protein [Laccaria bicolor S238N-H82]
MARKTKIINHKDGEQSSRDRIITTPRPTPLHWQGRKRRPALDELVSETLNSTPWGAC